jgi:prolyl-tRNA synthetase
VRDLLAISCTHALIGSPIAVSPLSINADVFTKVTTVLDSAISSSSELFAVRASAARATVFLHGTDIAKYLSTLETADTKVQVVDFAALQAEPVGAAPAKSTPGKKQEAKIEDAHQLAIGVKKEVDFATWYTTVRGAFRQITA